MKLKSKKSALLMSFTSLLICFAMLVGSTFAWFTDTASTGVNQIVSGKLRVDIVDKDGTHLDNLSFQDKDSKTDIRWEPGVTFLTQGFKIKNDGNLALKWKMAVNKGVKGEADDFDLKDVIDFSIVTIDKTADTPVETEVDLADFEGKLPSGMSEVYYLKGHMQESAGNDYQNLSLNDITVTVYATQLNHENDSYGPNYDKDATYLTYPAGVTKKDFVAAQEESKVDLAGIYTGEHNPNYGGADNTNKEANVAYVDADGNVKYAVDLRTAILKGASTIYCKEDAVMEVSACHELGHPNRSEDITSDLTIYANGADFQHGELALIGVVNTAGTNVNVTVYDAKNLRVWGYAPADESVTQNVKFVNCTYEGNAANDAVSQIVSGGIFYISGSTGTINLTLDNCKISKCTSGAYMNANGSVTVTNSVFEECATGLKISHRGTGNCNVTVKDTTFNKCGCTEEMAGTTSWLKDDSAAIKCKTTGTMTLTLKNNTITGTIGDKGDMQIAETVTVVNE